MANEPLNDEYEAARAEFLESFGKTEEFRMKRNKKQLAYYRELRSLRRVVRDRHGIRSVQNETARFLAVVQEWDNYLASRWDQFGGTPDVGHWKKRDYESSKNARKSNEHWKRAEGVIKSAKKFNAQVPKLSERLTKALEIETNVPKSLNLRIIKVPEPERLSYAEVELDDVPTEDEILKYINQNEMVIGESNEIIDMLRANGLRIPDVETEIPEEIQIASDLTNKFNNGEGTVDQVRTYLNLEIDPRYEDVETAYEANVDKLNRWLQRRSMAL